MQYTNTNPPLILKLLSFLPALALLCLIFGFSAQDGETSGSLSFQISLSIVEFFTACLPTSTVLSEDILLQRAELIHLFVRKAAHMTEYFLLALSLQLPLAAWFSQKLSFLRKIFIGLFCTVVLAAADEFHQTFIPGRSGNITDVGIDSIGAIAASLLLYLYFLFRHKKSKV